MAASTPTINATDMIKAINTLVAQLESAIPEIFQPLPHTFIPTEQISRGALIASERRLESLRFQRNKHAHAAIDAVKLFDEYLKSEREAMWTLEKQTTDFYAKKKLEEDRRSDHPFFVVSF